MPNRFEGKQALVLGVANRRSIAWAIAERLAAEGAQLAFTYQGERIEKGTELFADERGDHRLADRQCPAARRPRWHREERSPLGIGARPDLVGLGQVDRDHLLGIAVLDRRRSEALATVSY